MIPCHRKDLSRKMSAELVLNAKETVMDTKAASAPIIQFWWRLRWQYLSTWHPPVGVSEK